MKLIKKQLLELPVHSFPKKAPKTENKLTYDFYYAAEIAGDILHLTLFDWDSQLPRWKVFCGRGKWINYDLEQKRWGHATLENIGRRPDQYWRSNTFLAIDEESRKAGTIFFATPEKDTTEAVKSAQYRQKSLAAGERAKKQEERQEKAFAQWPSLPEGWQKRLEDGIWDESKYCFFRKRQKDDLSMLDRLIAKEFPGSTAPYIGECSACNGSFPLETAPQHDGERLTCPHCGAKLLPKKAGLGRKKLKEYAWYTVASERDGVIYADILNCWRYYETAPYQTRFDSSYRYLFDTNSGECRMWTYTYWGGWKENKTLREPPNLHYELDASFEDALQYNRLYFAQEYFLGGRLLKSMEIFTRYPCTEILCKLGMKKWVQELICGYTHIRKALNLKGKTLNEVTGLTKSQREFAVQQNMGGFDLLIYKRLLKEKQPCTAEDLEIVRNIYGYKQEFLQLLDRCGARRGLNYIKKQKKLYPKDSFNDILTFWKDYLEECRTLDYDLSDRYNLMPPDLRKAHNKTMELVAQRKNKANDVKIARRLPELEEKYHFEADNLLIRPAHTAGELVAEGKLLHHCVGSYVERYAKGETNILFVRKADEPEIHFVTTEYRGNTRRQAYASGNTQPPREVLAFLDKFEQYLNKGKKESATA
ncbi:MAG: PcfJ domain-containing protein [Negativibacillus sp.]